MYFKQYYLGCLSHASYMIADKEAGVAVVVDSQRDIDQYLADAKEQYVEINHVILTHFHADFLAGNIELRDQGGAEICMGAQAEVEFGFRKLGVITLGQVELRFLETSGHTPEGLSILVYDFDRSPSYLMRRWSIRPTARGRCTVET